MVLEYLQFESKGRKLLEYNDGSHLTYYSFHPLGEIPDELGEKVLSDRVLSQEFRKVGEEAKPSPSFRCDACDFVGKSKQSLLMHQRKRHKESPK